MARVRLTRAAATVLAAGLLALACAEGTPPTGTVIEVSNAAGVPAPEYLAFDWLEGERVLIRDRRVPETGLLAVGTPLAVIRIAASVPGDHDRQIRVRGMIGDGQVSAGSGAVRVIEGTWQPLAVVLTADGPPPDAGVPSDGSAPEGDAGVSDATADRSPDEGPPIDASGPDTGPAPRDTAADMAPDPVPDAGAPDLSRDVAADPPPAGPVTLAPIADSYVEQGGPATGMNHGTAMILEVKTQSGADNNRIAYLRFSLAGLAGSTINTATLRLFGRSSTGSHAESVYAVMDETWTETGITWNNKPAMAATKLATTTVTTTSQYREWAVTSFVRAQLAAGRPSVSLAVSMDMDTSASPDVHNAREAAGNQPQLVVTR